MMDVSTAEVAPLLDLDLAFLFFPSCNPRQPLANFLKSLKQSLSQAQKDVTGRRR